MHNSPMTRAEGTTLVLGASGFLGPHVVAAAVAHSGAEATFADPLGPPVVGACRRPELAPLFSNPRDAAAWEATDLSAPGAAAALLALVQPECVVSCLALSRVDECEAAPELARRINAEVAGEVAGWCAERDARLVHVSTDLVFGAEDAPEGGFTEAAAPAPRSVYGATKAEAESLVLDACRGALVVRLPLLYGNSGGRELGASDGLLAAVDRGEDPPLFVDEWRTPLEVQNAAAALVELLHTGASGILHVAGSSRVSRYELGLAVLRAMGLPEAEAVGLVRATHVADASASELRPRDVSLETSRASGLLATRLLGVREGTERAMR
ncbi:MAG: NAD-dependent epimerase/dehydratase family protein [Planctomycetota bacterium]|nr:MAG: NAD-dependent epimerase/dehydratase family protein [Planctomycetota bacterium]